MPPSCLSSAFDRPRAFTEIPNVQAEEHGNQTAGGAVSAGRTAIDVWVHVATDEPDWPAGRYHDLDASEQTRAERIRSTVHRRWFVSAHVALRSVLASYVRVSPEKIAFQMSDCGKPGLSAQCKAMSELASDLQFNMSHSDDVTLIAVSHGFEVGIDVERERPLLDWSAVSDLAFSLDERRLLQSCRDGQATERTRCFYRIWVRKEAYVKGLGTGLAAPLSRFCVLPVGEDVVPVADRQRTGPAEGTPEDWYVSDLAVAPGFAAALATPFRPTVQVRRLRERPESGCGAL